MKLLVVEDEQRLAAFLKAGLEEEGYVVDVARDGVEGAMMARLAAYDAILLDIVLPKQDGLHVLTDLRREGHTTPVLMVTSRGTVDDVVAGLDTGADDYLAKPFRLEELLARVRALTRRGGARRSESLTYGPITLDRLRHQVTVTGVALDLTPKEFQLLEYFLLHPEEVVTRTDLLEGAWETLSDPDSNVVDVHVAHLRHKLDDVTSVAWIQTIRGVGFILQGPEAQRTGH